MITTASPARAADTTVQIDERVYAEAHTAGTLGHFRAHYRGNLTVDEHGDWHFEGTVQFEDDFDMDPASHRAWPAELQVIIGAVIGAAAGAEGFRVTSEEVAVRQSRGDQHVEFVDEDMTYDDSWGGGSELHSIIFRDEVEPESQ